MERNLAPTSQTHSKGRDDHGFFCVFDRLICLLEITYHRINLLPVLLLRLQKNQHEIGSDGEILSLVSDDQSEKALVTHPESLMNHLNGICADAVHLRVKFHAHHSVTKINQAGPGIPLDDLLTFL